MNCTEHSVTDISLEMQLSGSLDMAQPRSLENINIQTQTPFDELCMTGVGIARGCKDCLGVIDAEILSAASNTVHYHLKQASFCLSHPSTHKCGTVLLIKLLAGSPAWNCTSLSPTVSSVNQLNKSGARAARVCWRGNAGCNSLRPVETSAGTWMWKAL